MNLENKGGNRCQFHIFKGMITYTQNSLSKNNLLFIGYSSKIFQSVEIKYGSFSVIFIIYKAFKNKKKIITIEENKNLKFS